MGKTLTQTKETEKMSKLARFQLFHVPSHESICKIEMDMDLLNPEAGIIDVNSLNFPNIKNGKQYTLIPLDDHKVATLKRVKEVYETVTTKPATMFTTHIGRMDELISVVGLLFGTIEYYQCETNEDFDMLINPKSDDDGPPLKKYNIIGDLLAEVEEETITEEE